ncbi:hypothetical protein MRX96_049954 [Rhipicephalus microplus]
MATQFGTARGGFLRSTIHIHDRRPVPWLAGTMVLQPLLDFLEHHCCQGQYFFPIRAAFQARINFLLDNHWVAFPSESQEHRARSHLERAAVCTRHQSGMPAATHGCWEGGALEVF